MYLNGVIESDGISSCDIVLVFGDCLNFFGSWGSLSVSVKAWHRRL